MTMSDGNFAKKLSPIMEDFEEEKLKRWESDESTNVCEEFISRVIWAISIIFIVVTFPFSLCVSIRMVQVRNLNVIIFYLLPIHIYCFFKDLFRAALDRWLDSHESKNFGFGRTRRPIRPIFSAILPILGKI